MTRQTFSMTTLLAATMFVGCQTTESPSASGSKTTTPVTQDAASTSKVSTTDASFADLKRAADSAASGLPSSQFDKAGFVTKVDDGRLWVFKKDAKELAEFAKHGELVKSVTRVAAGPNRMTVRAADTATIDAYLAAAPATVNPAPVVLPSSQFDKAGFVTKVDDGRLWVFKKDAKELAEFIKHGELVKSVTRVAVGPNRMTVRAADSATIDAYLAAEPKTVNAPASSASADPYARPGFITKMKDGRLWVFSEGAKELAEFEKHGELVKSVTRVAAGPNRVSVRAADSATIDAYLAAGQ